MLLNFVLVALNIRVVLQLATKLASALLKLSCNDLDSFFGFFELVLVRNSFELGALCHKTRVLLLELTLLVHHLGDLIADHLGHFFAHVGLKQVQVAQRLVSAF